MTCRPERGPTNVALNTSTMKVLFSPPSDLGHPYSLDVFEGHVYWTTKDKGEVWKMNKFGKGNKVKVLTINPWLTQVRIYQEHRHNQSGQNAGSVNISSHDSDTEGF